MKSRLRAAMGAVGALIAVTAGCGDNPPVSFERSSIATSTTQSAAVLDNTIECDETTSTYCASTERELVIEQRDATPREVARINNDDSVDCDDAGGDIWDYVPISESTEGGDVPQDALRDIVEWHARDGVGFPTSGWVELKVDEDHYEYVWPDAEGNWHASVTVTGDATRGIWQHPSSRLCGTDPDADYEPPETVATLAPLTTTVPG